MTQLPEKYWHVILLVLAVLACPVRAAGSEPEPIPIFPRQGEIPSPEPVPPVAPASESTLPPIPKIEFQFNDVFSAMQAAETVGAVSQELVALVKQVSEKKITARTKEEKQLVKSILAGTDYRKKCVALTVISSSGTSGFNADLINLLENDLPTLKKLTENIIYRHMLRAIPTESDLKQFKITVEEFADVYLKTQVALASVAILINTKEKKSLPVIRKIQEISTLRSMMAEALWQIGGEDELRNMVKEIMEGTDYLLFRYGKRVLNILVEEYRRKGNDDKRKYALLFQISRINDVTAAMRLREIVRESRKSGDDPLEDAASQALLSMAGVDDYELAMTMAGDFNERRRQRGLDLLGKIQSPKSIPRIMELINDPVEGISLTAIRILAEMKAKDALPELEKLVADKKSSSVSKQALFAIQAITGGNH